MEEWLAFISWQVSMLNSQGRAVCGVLAECARPWKALTFVLGLGLLVAGPFLFKAPDWDVPISLIMASLAYLTAPWCLRVILERRWKAWPLMLLLTWFSVDGCYWLYWSIKDPLVLHWMRGANAPASLGLYGICGLVWLHRGSARSLRGRIQDALAGLRWRSFLGAMFLMGAGLSAQNPSSSSPGPGPRARPAEVCERHRTAMVPRRTPVRYGKIQVQAAYAEARAQAFPHALEANVAGGCEPRRRRFLWIHVCPECTQARDAWLRARATGDPAPRMDPVALEEPAEWVRGANAILAIQPSASMPRTAAEMIFRFYFEHNIGACGFPGEPQDEGAFWICFPRIGYAGMTCPEPLRLHKESGRISWASGPGYDSLGSMVRAARD